MMRQMFLAATAVALISVTAGAADLPSREAPPPAPTPYIAPTVFSWTGFYAGVNAGWTRQENRLSIDGFSGFDPILGAGTDAALTAGFPARISNSRDGFIGGAQVGYNQQFDMFVVGVEADINFLGNGRSTVSALGPSVAVGNIAPNTMTINGSSRTEWLGTARLRAGAAIDRLLVYGTGGLAFGSPNHTLSVVQGGVVTHTGSDDDMQAGWTLGGGGEYAFTDNLTMKAEYLYYDLGRTSVTARYVGADARLTNTTLRGRFDNRGHIARVGLNYKF